MRGICTGDDDVVHSIAMVPPAAIVGTGTEPQHHAVASVATAQVVDADASTNTAFLMSDGENAMDLVVVPLPS